MFAGLLVVLVSIFSAESFEQDLESNFATSNGTNDCALGTHNCNVFAKCIYGGGSNYTCTCVAPFQGDGITCVVGGAFAPVSSPAAIQPTKTVTPELLCWTSGSKSNLWTAYMSYYSLNIETVTVPLGVENIVTSPSVQNGFSFSSQTTVFYPGTHLAWSLPNNQITFPAPSAFEWTLDGFVLSVDATSDPQWSSRECPTSIEFTLPISIMCPAPNLVSTLEQNLVTLINNYKASIKINSTGENVTINVPNSNCTTGRIYSVINATVNTSPAVIARGSGLFAMDLLFSLLQSYDIAKIVKGTSAQVVPKVLADVATISLDSFNVLSGTTQISSSPDSDMVAFGTPASYFSFGLYLASVLLFLLSFVATINVCFLARRAANRRKESF